MAAITCTRRLEFDAAHRVTGHEGKCKDLHGHRYALEVTFAAETLDRLGRVVDFSVIKEKLGAWIGEHWDHTTILFDKDQALGKAITGVTGQKIFYLPANPTAENLAEYVMKEICPQLFSGMGLTCTHVRLYETPHCWAEIA